MWYGYRLSVEAKNSNDHDRVSVGGRKVLEKCLTLTVAKIILSILGQESSKIDKVDIECTPFYIDFSAESPIGIEFDRGSRKLF